MHVIGIIISLAFALLGYWGYLRSERRRRLYEDTPTSKTAGVFIGDVELEGTAESPEPAAAPLSGEEAVWYDWKVEEEWRRVERVKLSPERAKELQKEFEEQGTTGWTKVAGSSEVKPFYLKDDTGSIRINPEKAFIEPKQTFCKTCGAQDRLYYQFGPKEAVGDSTGQRRFSESVIPLHAPIFVLGHSRVRGDAVAAEIAWDENCREYLISTNLEKDVVSGIKTQSVFCRVLVLLFSALAAGIIMKDWHQAGWGAAAGAAALVPGWLWIVHQSMVRLKNRSKQAMSNVDVELKRRYSLITPLIEAVKGMRAHEAETQTDLAALRSQAGVRSVNDASREGVLVPVSKQMLAVIEKYPELKSNTLFSNLQKNLVETENRIALARQYYNDTVEYVNSRREAFPEGIVARLSGVRKQNYFHAESFERPPVKAEL